MHQMEMPKYVRVVAGAYGKILRNKIQVLVILKSSVLISQKQIGNLLQSQP